MKQSAKQHLVTLTRQAQAWLTLKNLMWVIYVSLLCALFKHTAWAFARFQEPGSEWLSYLLAFTFEAVIFALTHRMVEAIERSHRLRQVEEESRGLYVWRRWSEAYLNTNSVALCCASLVSFAANFSYAAEFSQPFTVYTDYSIPPILYQLAFGGILPLMSLLFSSVLANTHGEQANNSVEDMERTITQLRQSKEEAEQQKLLAKQQVKQLRAAVKFVELTHDSTEVRVKAAKRLWPDVTQATLAEIAGASPSYTSQVLNRSNGKGE